MKTIKIITILTFTIALLTLGFTKVLAQGLSIQVAPARQEIVINPGEDVAVNVRFFNLETTPISGIIKATDFIVVGKDGAPRIIDDSSQASPRFSASSWITLPYDKITIAPENKVEVQVKIQVPTNARPGGRYVAIFFEPTGTFPQPVGGKQEAATAVASRIASLLYIRISGDITENAFISRLYTPSFTEYGPINIISEIINKGDYHIRPDGVITLSNMFGGIVAQDKLEKANIFPDSAREYNNTIGYKWMMGRYKITSTAAYGEKGQAISRATYVWVFPWRIAIIVLLGLIIILLLARQFYRNILTKSTHLEKEVKQDQKEIEKLKEELRKKE